MLKFESDGERIAWDRYMAAGIQSGVGMSQAAGQADGAVKPRRERDGGQIDAAAGLFQIALALDKWLHEIMGAICGHGG